MSECVREMTFEEETCYYEAEARAEFAKENNSGSDSSSVNNILRRGMRIIRKSREKIKELEETVVHQRSRAQTAEDFVCKLCAECDYEDHDGITAMTMKCCSMFPECGKFKLRSGWIPVSERLPDSEKIVLVSAITKQFRHRHTLMVAHIGHHEFTTEDNDWREYEGKTEYDEENDCFWIPECWYEVNAIDDNGNWIIDSEYDVTHWMPLPEPPKEEDNA